MAATLIIDGQDFNESGEGLLVEHLARTQRHHVVRLPYVPQTKRAWSMIWFTGHCTVYRSAGFVSAELRVDRWYYRVGTLTDLQQLTCDLLVLSSCYTKAGVPPGPRFIITHDGPVANDVALIFAAALAPKLSRSYRQRKRVKAVDLKKWFTQAAKASGSNGWHLMKGQKQ